MKTWIWVLIGIVVFVVTGIIGIAMYRRSKGGNSESLEKARLVKKEKAEAEKLTVADELKVNEPE